MLKNDSHFASVFHDQQSNTKKHKETMNEELPKQISRHLPNEMCVTEIFCVIFMCRSHACAMLSKCNRIAQFVSSCFFFFLPIRDCVRIIVAKLTKRVSHRNSMKQTLRLFDVLKENPRNLKNGFFYSRF